MKMLVLVKQVPDTATQVKVGSDPRAIDQTGITWIVSPYDEFALEEALRIKEKRGRSADEVVAVTLGPERAKEALRSCLAMGADRAIHVNDGAFERADTLTAARALAAVVRAGEPAARADRSPGDRRRHGRDGRAGGGDPRLAVHVLDHGGGRHAGRGPASAWAGRWRAVSRSSTCRSRAS